MNKYFSGSGDDGTTGMIGEKRVSKTDSAIEAIGSVDELSAFLGFAKCQLTDKKMKLILDDIQRDLYRIMSELAAAYNPSEGPFAFSPEQVKKIEQLIDQFGKDVEIPKEFILPGANQKSAAFSVCRTLCRRAERRIVFLFEQGKMKNKSILSYLNRLSSFLFLLEIKYSESDKPGQLKFARS